MDTSLGCYFRKVEEWEEDFGITMMNFQMTGANKVNSVSWPTKRVKMA